MGGYEPVLPSFPSTRAAAPVSVFLEFRVQIFLENLILLHSRCLKTAGLEVSNVLSSFNIPKEHSVWVPPESREFFSALSADPAPGAPVFTCL